jgi:serine phosphatase RsbU (regulator of sigma subunit)/CHASE2 domain-containing sensor protein
MLESSKEQLARFAADPRRMIGAFLVAILLGAHAVVWLLPSVFEPLQSQVIDRLYRLRAQTSAFAATYDGTVFLVPIDDESLQQRESYYLVRQDYARLIENLGRAGVAAQFLDVIFAAPETAEGDRALADALRSAGHAYIGMAVGASTTVEALGPTAPSPAHQAILDAQRWHLRTLGDAGSLLQAQRYFMTFPEVTAAARGSGFLDVIPDRDGTIRRVPLVVRDRDGFLPGLFLLVLCDYLGVQPSGITIEPGRQVVLPGAHRPGSSPAWDIAIPIDAQGQMIVNFIGAWGSLQTYPFSTIYAASDDRYEMEDLRHELGGRLALVTWFSTGRGDVGAVPTDPVYPRAGVWANAMNTILTGEFMRELAGWPMLLLVEIPLIACLFFAATRWSTIPFVLCAMGLSLIYLLVVGASFLGANLILGVPVPLLVLAVATPTVAAYHFQLESQRRAKMHRELAVAREIQLGTLPKTMPDVDGYDLAGHSVPADETGGDSFDVIPLKDHQVMLLIGDATGHGIGPALSVTQVRAMLRIAVRLDAGFDDMVTQINDQLAEDLSAGRFVTAFFGIADARSHRVTHHSAGQGPLLHFHAASGECEWFGSSRMALGMFGGMPGKSAKSLEMQPGDILGLMTDGVLEQENSAGEPFGQERVEALVRQDRHRPVTELMTAILREVETHRGAVRQTDDVTVLLFRRLPGV